MFRKATKGRRSEEANGQFRLGRFLLIASPRNLKLSSPPPVSHHLFMPLSPLASFYDKIHSVTGLAVAELKHLEHHMLQVIPFLKVVWPIEVKPRKAPGRVRFLCHTVGWHRSRGPCAACPARVPSRSIEAIDFIPPPPPDHLFEPLFVSLKPLGVV